MMGSSDSPPLLINGLKFGQKIYFEDDHHVGHGAPPKSSSGSSSSSSSSSSMAANANANAAAKKGGRNGGVVQGGTGHPPRCQVEGCKLDLSDAKPYYSRHKVCGMHSKCPVVIVAGLEQRFCQQCSRFHQLPEFDQGKRSCRRRLAGHNERRRKPPPGSMLSSRLGRLSSSLFGDSSSRSGGVLLDFSSYSSNSEKDSWPGTKGSQQGSQTTSAEKYHQTLWSGSSEDQSSEMFLQGSGGGNTSYPIPSGECITGVSSDSSCALSLLSNTWGSRNRASGSGLGNLMNLDGASMPQATVTQTVTVAQLPSSNGSSWGFKGHEDNDGLQVAPPDHHLGLGQISHPLNGHYNSDLLMDQVSNGGRHYMEVDHSRAYNSATNGHVHWSL